MLVPSPEDTCVHCGLCLPHCPTFQVTGNEAFSPRGRILLAASLKTSSEQTPSQSVSDAMDSCLNCGACVRVCPAKVPYFDIVKEARTKLPQRRIKRALFFLLERAWLMRAVSLSIGWLHRLRIFSLFNAMQKRWFVSTRRHAPFVVSCTQKSAVGLWVDCASLLFSSPQVKAALSVLTTVKGSAKVMNTSCCGALHRHHGRPHNRLAKKAQGLFADYDSVVSMATGCQDTLSTYDDEGIMQSLESVVAMECKGKQLCSSKKRRWLVHKPCTQSEEDFRELYAFLDGIEGVSCTPFREGCCGAGGITMLSYPSMSEKLASPIVGAVRSGSFDAVLSGNPGCILWLESVCAREKIATSVCHWIEPVATLVVSESHMQAM